MKLDTFLLIYCFALNCIAQSRALKGHTTMSELGIQLPSKGASFYSLVASVAVAYGACESPSTLFVLLLGVPRHANNKSP